MAPFLQGVVLLLSVFAASPSAVASPSHASPLVPSDQATRRNAFDAFNAIHSAMRQWGSSLNHNGMSFFLATVPEGQLLYHGGPEDHRPAGFNGKGFDWMAFELEHAQLFAAPRPRRRSSPPTAWDALPPAEQDQLFWGWSHPERFYGSHMLASPSSAETGQQPMMNEDKSKPKEPVPESSIRGYFHTYRAARPLNLIYIDGMSAGKAPYGSLDTQDLVLLGWPVDDTNTLRGELGRAGGLCKLAEEWAWDGGKIDGFIRAEAGFEIIYCDFSEAGGLDVVSIQGSPFANETGGFRGSPQMELLRAASLRYRGFPSGRFSVDWSSIVSAFFYDLNLTNPDASRPELPRLANTTCEERNALRERVRHVVATRHGLSSQAGAVIDWQGIVDIIATRFSSRLDLLVRDNSSSYLPTARNFVATFLNPFIGYPDVDAADLLLDRCASRYLLPALSRRDSWTAEDHSIYTAVETVTRSICSSLFDIRAVLFNGTVGNNVDTPDDLMVEAVRKIATDLVSKLQWTTWKECDHCQQPSELCLVAMFPWGDDEDHFHPRCKKPEEVWARNGYWWKRAH